MGAKINDAVIAIIKQEFMAGASLRELAVNHGVSLRTLAARSKDEEWAVARDLQQSATAVPALIKAADARAQAVSSAWQDKVGGIMSDLMEVSRRIGELLRLSDLSTMDPRELVTMIKILSDSMARMVDRLPATEQRSLHQVSIEELRKLSRAELIDAANRGLISDVE
jgi:hypothetical protein